MGGSDMTKSRAFLTVCLLLLSVSIVAPTLMFAEVTEAVNQLPPNSLAGKHTIELGIGLLSEIRASTEVSTGNTITESDANGLIGSIAYTRWLEDDVGIHITSGVLDVDAATAVNGSETFVEASTVVPLLFGVKYQPFGRAIGDAMRPYISASAGPYFGFSSNVRTGESAETESYSETALGARIGAGVDLSLSRLFTLGLGAGYHFVDDFNRRIGTEKNYSSPDFSLSFGIVFGRGKQY
jgi:hypothetical protein